MYDNVVGGCILLGSASITLLILVVRVIFEDYAIEIHPSPAMTGKSKTLYTNIDF